MSIKAWASSLILSAGFWVPFFLWHFVGGYGWFMSLFLATVIPVCAGITMLTRWEIQNIKNGDYED